MVARSVASNIILRLHEQEGPQASWTKLSFAAARSTLGCGMPTVNVFTACQELIVQSIDLARLIGRDILQMQGSQLVLGWLVIVTIANRPWSLVKWRGIRRRSDVCQQQRRENQCDPKDNLP
jgi:hypothetical protein